MCYTMVAKTVTLFLLSLSNHQRWVVKVATGMLCELLTKVGDTGDVTNFQDQNDVVHSDWLEFSIEQLVVCFKNSF